jgi:putative membrane protein
VTEADAGAWRRLDRRMLLIHPIQELPRALPALLAAFVAGNGSGRGLLWTAAALVITLGFAFSRWFTTRYRLTEDRVEVGSGLFQRRVRAVSRDRIRTVDVTARAMHRLLGLARVDVGTGRSDRSGDGGVRLDGLTEAEAARLRQELLHRGRAQAAADDETADAHATPDAPATAGGHAAGTAPAPVPAAAAAPETELARLDPTWVRFAPFTLSGVVSIAVVAGFVLNALNEAGFDPANWGPARHLADSVGHAPVVLTALVLTALAIVAVVIASTVGYALAFWDFRLTRHPGGTLHVTRGLITTRATTIEERRLHGAEISEPLLLRMATGARLIAIATGLRVGRGAERGGSLLVPPAPRAAVGGVAAQVIGDPAPMTCPLVEHGPRARRRRYTRALAGWVPAAAALAIAHWAAGAPAWLPAAALVLLPIAAALAADRYRSLGHAVSGPRLVVRSGSLIRRRCVLSAEGIIGWNVERSLFQRRAGLVTLTATTAAGEQHYDMQDVELGEALRVARALVPGLVEPFLERPPVEGQAAAREASSAAGGSPASSAHSRVR